MTYAVEKTSRQTYGAVIVPALIERGDQALQRDLWAFAENCYLGAYFCNGGDGPEIRTKIKLVQQLHAKMAEVADAWVRIEAVQFSEKALESALKELADSEASLVELHHLLPGSKKINEMQTQLRLAMTRGHALLDEMRAA